MAIDFAALPVHEGLHDPLLTPDGQPVNTPEQWQSQRAYWQALATQYMWGTAPQDVSADGRVIATSLTHGGKAVQETVQIFYGPKRMHSFFAAIVRPNRPGRHPAITWNLFETPFEKPCPIEETAIERGYVLAGFDKEQLMYDRNGHREDAKEAYPGFTWNAVRIWAWGHSLLASYLLSRDDIDPDQLVATGHSRGGKAALAAAVCDSRFRVCAPINSGCGGAGCFRLLGDRNGLTQDVSQVECLGRVGHVFPHWWTEAFLEFGDPTPPHAPAREAQLPFDLHILKALIAPRALITCEGLDDTWANPYGTWRTWQAAQPVYDLLNVPDNNAIFYREGGHAYSAEDWLAVLDFCDQVFDRQCHDRAFNRAPY